ncbi:hypothetical protein [Mycoplasma suis]|uniref:Uncharacterized protein n=2 Tax=Mycoplasma suis TaxID=57372 RepID=F0QS20_MYCSL|nr:hypothetical protein [Mycoplasma suis]ADX98290.1 hypothetical protein MSU_0765 [Mycoplasma suis str. Illinois]CBZ40804.1 hypothetical protein MSUIS_07110 [Mycoplasma suis KI3806]
MQQQSLSGNSHPKTEKSTSSVTVSNSSQGNSRVRRDSGSSSLPKTQQSSPKAAPSKTQAQKPIASKPFSPFDVPKLNEKERQQSTVVKETRGERISCLHTWWGGYYNGATCRSW